MLSTEFGFPGIKFLSTVNTGHQEAEFPDERGRLASPLIPSRLAPQDFLSLSGQASEDLEGKCSERFCSETSHFGSEAIGYLVQYWDRSTDVRKEYCCPIIAIPPIRSEPRSVRTIWFVYSLPTVSSTSSAQASPCWICFANPFQQPSQLTDSSLMWCIPQSLHASELLHWILSCTKRI